MEHLETTHNVDIHSPHKMLCLECKSEKIMLLKRGAVITPFLQDCLLICLRQMFEFAFLLVFLTKYYLGDEIKEEEMHRACGTCGRVGGHNEHLLQGSVGET